MTPGSTIRQAGVVSRDVISDVLDLIGLRASRILTLKDVPFENGSWLVEIPNGELFVLRRYHVRAAPADIAYEHAVLRYLATRRWIVSEPIGESVQCDGAWYCPTRYVPGQAVRVESTRQRRRRGEDLARINVALRDLGQQLGQRPGWRPQHHAVSIHTDIDWDDCLDACSAVDAALASWAAAAAVQTREALAALGADDLPVTVVHGDFTEWNVHYENDRLAGVIDFGLTHLDSRPYELAIARAYRAPEVIDSYRAELARSGWPLSELEERAIVPINRAFRVDMVAWQLDHGRRTGDYDTAMIRRQLQRTGTTPP